MSKVEITQRRLAATARGVGIMCDFYIEKAKNAELWDTDGNRYIDFAGGIGVLNTGHLHPKVQAAVAEQLTKFSHTCYQLTMCCVCLFSISSEPLTTAARNQYAPQNIFH